MFRLTASCLALMTLTWTVMAQDQADANAVRSAFESRFDTLDANNDGQLDENELSKFPAVDLPVLHSHGLPVSTPVSRDAFVAASVALVEEAPKKPTEPVNDSVPGKSDGATEPVKPPEAGVPTRNSARKGRYVPELPAEFSARDKNGDGQIALYEWERKKYAEFAKLDKNGDGFLTPTELMPKESLKTLYSKTPGRTNGTTPLPVAATTASGETNEIDKEARGKFMQLDVNKDGVIDESDWGRSRQTRSLFESAGINVSLPMNTDTFIAHYRQTKESAER